MLVTGGLALRALRRGLGDLLGETAKIRDLDFSPREGRAQFREVDDVLGSLERAKTMLRTLGKYAPVDLVKQLFRSNKEPELGGELMTISIMFSDIEGFTQLSERLSPDELAKKLGLYLEAMTQAIVETKGTIDKFIGDAVMAIWNAPTPMEGHSTAACRAVLLCQEKLRALYASKAWEGLPSLTTRFGVHTGEVMVGHFGAPARLSYTALGDGVNLAARLEGLGKQYGVTRIVSEAVVAEIGDEFRLRVLDVVAVKGKSRAVRVYELLGRAEGGPEGGAVTDYGEAFAAYLRKDFRGSMDFTAKHPDDPPSATLHARCEKLLAHPPGEDWNGVYVAKEK